MKYMMSIFLSLSIFYCSGLSALAGCRVTCILPSRSETDYWNNIETYMRTAAQEYDADLSFFYTDGDDASLTIEKNTALEIAILSETDAIITTYSYMDTEMNTLLQEARENGIRIILIDSDGPSSSRDLFIGIDNQAAGKMAGEYIQKKLPEGKTTLLISQLITESRPNLQSRIVGIQSSYAEVPELLNLYTESLSTVEESLKFENYLKENPDIGAIIAITDSNTVSCAQILQRMGLSDEIFLFGFDLGKDSEELLSQGVVDAVLCYDSEQMGYESIRLTASLLEGDSIVSDIFFVDFEILESETEVQEWTELHLELWRTRF